MNGQACATTIVKHWLTFKCLRTQHLAVMLGDIDLSCLLAFKATWKFHLDISVRSIFREEYPNWRIPLNVAHIISWAWIKLKVGNGEGMLL